VSFEIRDGVLDRLRVVSELTEPAVAHLAEDAADDSGAMVVIDVDRGPLETDGAERALTGQESVELLESQSVLPLEVVLTTPTLPQLALSGLLVVALLAIAVPAARSPSVARELLRRLVGAAPRANHETSVPQRAVLLCVWAERSYVATLRIH
jgi:hypothetical protein